MKTLSVVLALLALSIAGLARADRSDVWSTSSAQVQRMTFHRTTGNRIFAEVCGAASKGDAGTLRSCTTVLLPQGGALETSVLNLMNGQALTTWKASEEL